MNININKEFKNIVSIILDTDEISIRNLKLKEKLFTTISINPYNSIVNFDSRQFNWKYFCGELFWYLQGNNNIGDILYFSKFWDLLKDKNNNVNSNYGKILIHDNPQIKWVIDNLLKDNNTRKAILTINSEKFQFNNENDFPCTMYLNFFIRDNKLNMKVQMRSNDIFYGFTYDVPFFSLIQQSIYLILKKYIFNLEMGMYYHCSDNTHIYDKHYKLSNKILLDKNTKNFSITLKEPLINEYGRLSDVSLEFIKLMQNMRGSWDLMNSDDYKILLTKILDIKYE